MEQNNSNQIDDRLANYVDALVVGDEPAFDTDQEELHELEETVHLLWTTLGDEDPPAAMVERIKENLDLEWQEKRAQEEDSKILSFPTGRSFTSAFAAVAAVAVLILAVVFLTNGATGGDIPGTATGVGNSLVMPLLLLALIGAAVFFYSQREK